MSSRRNQFDEDNPLANASISEIDELVYGQLGAINKPKAESALAPTPDGTIQVGKVKLTPTGLQFNGELTTDEWNDLGGFLKKLDKSTQWLIGDWLVYGSQKLSRDYKEVAKQTGYSEKTLRNFAYVAGAVHLSLRRENLSYGHHAAVASLKPKLQEQWLDYAESSGVSVSRLQRELRELSSQSIPKPKTRIEKFSHSYTTFAKSQLALAREADQGERMAMAEMLRQLAERIEGGE